MILLDTNDLILGLVSDSREGRELVQWARTGQSLVTSVVCWYEFLSGPVSPVQIKTMRAFLHRSLPFDEPEAVAAAQLFNSTGRKRARRVDSMIAANALMAQASLATNNRIDFEAFVPHGLKLDG